MNVPATLHAEYRPADFACHCGCSGHTLPSIAKKLMAAHEAARGVQSLCAAEIKVLPLLPLVTIMSAYRCLKHNTAVGGEDHSRHMEGDALDIKVSGMSPEQVHAIIDKAQRTGMVPKGGLGLYGTFVHFDQRGSLARWIGTRTAAALVGNMPGTVVSIDV